jgi:acetyl esterase/lipase
MLPTPEAFMKRVLIGFLASIALLTTFVSVRAGDEPYYTRQEDVIYGRKYGTALTLDVFTPKKDANSAAIIIVISGGWFSAHEGIDADIVKPFVERGYTIFTVVHGSQPKFTIPEILEDMNRAVRFIRFHAKDYKIDPDRIGIVGSSAGGHLSLMQGTRGDKGNADAKDPIDKMSSRVQAVACFFPPTDFLNYGEKGKNAIGRGVLADLRAAFDFKEFDNKQESFVSVTDEDKILELGKRISPIYHVTADSAPTLIIHGDADERVPIQQAETMVEKLKGEKVPAELVVRKGAAHGWPDWVKDLATFADWFDKYLAKK